MTLLTHDYRALSKHVTYVVQYFISELAWHCWQNKDTRKECIHTNNAKESSYLNKSPKAKESESSFFVHFKLLTGFGITNHNRASENHWISKYWSIIKQNLRTFTLFVYLYLFVVGFLYRFVNCVCRISNSMCECEPTYSSSESMNHSSVTQISHLSFSESVNHWV